MTDKRTHIASFSVLTVLLIALILPQWESGRIIAAILLLPAAVLLPLFIKKRNILSINKNQVLLIMTVIALVYVMLYYLTGLRFGFYKNPYRLTGSNFLKFFLPITLIILSTEVIRYVLMAQRGKLAWTICYLSCLIADMLICTTIPEVTSFNRFMDLVAGTLFPAVLSNLLYNYLTRRYGLYPNLVFRLITVLHGYLFPVTSGISESLVHFFALLLPVAVYFFIDSLYEKRRTYALGNTSRFRRVMAKVFTVLAVVIMLGVVMLVSNHFKYGALVIATESMTGELNKGDVAIFESYGGQNLVEGQVIVYEKKGSMVLHRVVDIQIINGIARYYTKGDANENMDAGFITDADIVGTVNYKVPLLGYPTLWLRSLFKR